MTSSGVRVTHPAPLSTWGELASQDPDILVTQSPDWLDVVCRVGGYRDVSRLYEMADGRQLLLPMVERTGVVSSLHIEASMPPAWGMGGLIGANPRADDIAAVFDDLRSVRSARIQLRPNPLHAGVWKAGAPSGVSVIPRLAHVLDLAGGYDTVWNERFKPDTRRRIRKALRSDLRVELDTTGRLIPEFYELLALSFDRWARIQHEPTKLARLRGRRRDPIAKFNALADVLGERFRLWVATLNGQPVAALVILQGRNAHFTRGAMDEETAGVTNANYLLHQLAIQDACTAGCRTYHMGESGRSPGLAQFKSRFGAQPIPYAEYRLERLPLTHMDSVARGLVKRMIGFRDA